MDSGSGAYLFEYFLALVCGGKVEGKSKTAAGQMAATDFSMNGKKGSAKYYRDSAGLSQASAGFLGGDTTYVIGLKKQDMLQIPRAQGGTDPDKLVAIDLHFLTVKKHRTTGKITVNGEEHKGSRVYLTSYVNQQSKGDHVIYLANVYTKTFRDMIDEAIKNVSGRRTDGIKQAYESMRKLYDSIRETESQSKMYIASDDPTQRVDAGLKTLESIEAQDNSFRDLINVIDFGGTLDKEELKESNENNLDQLIESVMKEKLLK